MLDLAPTASRLLRAVRAMARAALDIAYPPQCLACSAPVLDPSTLCAACWADVRQLDGALCATCGEPFAFAVPEETRCGACLKEPPVFAAARAPLAYGDTVRTLVLALKRRDRHEGVSAFARWMVRAGGPLLRDADVLVPVPLHGTRLFRRRFNQSALLARGISARTGLPVLPDALVRHRSTRSQGGLSRGQRIRNVAGAFRLRPGRAERMADRHVLLIDDVLTTGATANACARVLLKGGAASVSVLVLAKRTLED
jgi:ComF family protein